MYFDKIRQLNNNAKFYLAKCEELINTNREEAKRYLKKAEDCRREAKIELGITSEKTKF